MSLLRATATVGGPTLLSRVLGFVRDQLMAHFVGAGLANDAFLVAWRLPNLFRALFAEGAFASAFVPMFNRTVAAAEKDGAAGLPAGVRFSDEVLSILLPFLCVFTMLVMAFPRPVVWLISLGFKGSGGAAEFDLAVELTRITFPYLLLISLVSLLGGILNSLHRFWVNAMAPVLLNVCMIAALLFFRGHDATATTRTQAIAVTVSGVAQLAWLVWSCRRAGVVLRLRRPTLNPQVRQLLGMIWPAAIGAGAVQFNQTISSMLALGFLPGGSVSALYYADRLNQLPLALVGIGVGTAILPSLSRQIGGGDETAAAETQNRAIELSLLLTLPATAALMIAATPLVRGVFQSGAFGPDATVRVAGALSAYAIGLPAYILIKVLTPGFYARADTKTPFRIAVAAMAVNLAFNLALVFGTNLAHVGLALSTALAAWVNMAGLYLTLRRRGHFRVDARLKDHAMRLLGATVAMAVVLLLLDPIVDAHLGSTIVPRVAWLSALIGAAGLAYFGAAFALGAFRLADLRAMLARRRRA